MVRAIFFALTITAALVTGCATVSGPGCQSGQQPMISEMVYFGTSKPNGTVSSEEWRAFLSEIVTPRFPQGLSVWQASGQWKSASGPIVREGSYVLNIVHAGGAPEDRALNEVATAYKTRFLQESVLRVRSAACVTF